MQLHWSFPVRDATTRPAMSYTASFTTVVPVAGVGLVCFQAAPPWLTFVAPPQGLSRFAVVASRGTTVGTVTGSVTLRQRVVRRALDWLRQFHELRRRRRRRTEVCALRLALQRNIRRIGRRRCV